MKNKTIVILGGGYAGLLAAARISRQTEHNIILIDSKAQFVQRIRLHEALTGSQPKVLPYKPLLNKRGIEFIQAEVSELNPNQGCLSFASGEDQDQQLNFDYLIYALGSAIKPVLQGASTHALSLNSPQDSAQGGLRLAEINAREGTVVVLGGGISGIEVATEISDYYPQLNVKLITRGEFASPFSKLAQAHLRESFSRHNITIVEHTEVTELRERHLITSHGHSISFHLCIPCSGFKVPDLARKAGLGVDPSGRIQVDPYLRSLSHANVFAAGDCANVQGISKQPLRMSCAAAMPLGITAGENLLATLQGKPMQPFSMAFMAQCLSLGRQQGLIQFTNGDDSPKENIWTDRKAVMTKEFICRMTYAAVHWELKTGLRLYRWPKLKRSGPHALTSSVPNKVSSEVISD